MPHTPVLLEETIAALDPRSGETVLDGTVGGGGHLAALLQKMGGRGSFIAVDLDEDNLQKAREKIARAYPQARQFWVKGNYADAPSILSALGIDRVDVLLLDLGFSSEHLASGRGFSFLQPGEKLDMRYDPSLGPTAADILNGSSEDRLADVFWKYGEERWSRRAAKAIVIARKKKKIESVGDLLEIIEKVVPKTGKINPATKIFQALRIATNSELQNLERFLSDIPIIVRANGRVAIISFHSLEDRMVKTAFRDLVKSGRAELVLKKPAVPSVNEVERNPRSRSAKLRAIKIV